MICPAGACPYQTVDRRWIEYDSLRATTRCQHTSSSEPSDYPDGKEDDVLTVEFTVRGIPCLGLSGGPTFKHSEAFSFQIATDNQEETDRYWNAIAGNGNQESACGWCRS